MERAFSTRCEAIGIYMVLNQSTVRKAAKIFGISKSVVFEEITKKLPQVNPGLFDEVRNLLDYNKSQRSIRGGAATKRKYELLKLSKKR